MSFKVWKHIFFKIILILLIVVFLSCAFIFFKSYLFLKKDSTVNNALVTLEINKGENWQTVSNKLKISGVVKNTLFFKISVLIHGSKNKLKAGNYNITVKMPIVSLIDLLIRGSVKDINFTVKEGWTLKDISRELERLGLPKRDVFYRLTGWPNINYIDYPKEVSLKIFSVDFVFLKDKPPLANLEGYLFPDTYKVSSALNNQGLEEAIKLMLANFDNHWEKLNFSKSNHTVFETVIVASLLEKEVMGLQDKRKVSGIIWKRLKENIPLELDSALFYDLQSGEKDLSWEDKMSNSLYNVYKNVGLPLGPICNPGEESLEAALNPQSTDYYYFLTTEDGRVIYSKNLKEHNIAKEKYL